MTGDQIIKQFEAMSDYAKGNWENLWSECADWCWPTNDNINNIRMSVKGVEKPPQRMIDTCIEANYNFASGFFSHMFPPSIVWAVFRHSDPKMMKIQAVQDYFSEVSKIVSDYMLGSNFAQEEFQALLALGCFGTNCLSIEEDEKETLRFRNFIVGKIRMGVNHLGMVDTHGLEYTLNAKQAIQKFGEDALKKAGLGEILEAYANGEKHEYEFVHMVTPRVTYDEKKADSKNKPYGSYHVSKKSKKIVKEGGFELNPFKTGRFMVGNDEIYGRGPMSMVLGTSRRTNVIYRTLLLAAERDADETVLIPDDDSVKGLKNRAREVIKWRVGHPNGAPEIIKRGDLNTPAEMYRMHEDQIRRMFFNHLFRPLEDYRNMTFGEVQERIKQDMMLLTPFTSRYQDEHITPTMHHVFYILQKKGKLPDVPPEIAEDPNYEIDYVGPLSLATKNFENAGAIQTISTFIELGQVDPGFIEALDGVNKDKLFSEIWYGNSANINARNSEDEVKEIREQRAKAQQQQMIADNIPKLADAAQKVSGPVDKDSILARG